MRTLGLGLLALFAAAPAAVAQKEFGFDNRKGSGQPYLTPAETVARMKVAPGFEVKLFAGEPMLANPIAFTIDERGRVWAVECFEYPKKTPKGKKPRDRIVILEDTDGDGVCDKRTVFAEGKDFPETFDMASGIEVGNGGVYLGAPPYLWFIENKNDKPGKFEVLLKGFGSEDTHETLNTFQWGPDGWLYGLHGIFTQSKVKPLDGPETRMNAAVWRFHPKTKTFEIFAEGTSNPWGMDWRNTDGQFILACCVIPHLFHMVPGGVYKRQAGASYNPFSYGYINEICDHTFHKESGWAHAGLISLDAPHIPKQYRDSVIFGSIHGCSLKQNILKPNGSSYTASRGDDFLVSGDKNFRPINMKWGPNGDIYLIDWHDQNPCHQTNAEDWDYERGRVYRIQVKGREAKKMPDLAGMGDTELLKVAFNSPDPWEYRTALRVCQQRNMNIGDLGNMQREMVRRWALLPYIMDKKVKDAGFLWLTDDFIFGMAVIQPDTFALVVRSLGEYEGKNTAKVVKWIVDHLDKSPVAVRREAASAAIRLGDKHDVSALVHALMARKEDAKDPMIPHLVWLAYEKILTKPEAAGAVETEMQWLTENAAGNAFVTDVIVPRVMRRLVATGKPADLASCVKFAAAAADKDVRRQALAGLVEGLKGTTTDAPPGWQKLRLALVASKDPAQAEFANKLGVAFRDPQAFKRVLAVATNPKRTDADRAEAVRQLALIKNADVVGPLLALAKEDKSELVRLEAVRGLAGFAGSDVPAGLVVGWKTFPPAVRAEVVNVLAGRKEWAATLLTGMKEGIIDRTAVTDTTITRIQGFKDRTLNALIEDAWGRTRATPDELVAVIDKMRVELAAGPGSFARGKKVFEAQCAKCHKFDGAGADVGPALDGAGRDIEYLLANILDPNRVIGAPYFVRQVNLLDGQLVQGVLAEEDPRSVTLKVENGVLKKILKADMDGEMKTLEKSMMPEGLGYNMTPQDFRDLVRYAMNGPYFSAVTVNGAAAAAAVTGRIPVPAGGEKPVVIEAKFTADAAFATQLLVGSADGVAVKLDGKEVGTAPGAGKGEPDRSALPVTLTKGDHTLTLTLTPKAAGGVYTRLLDPDRKLRYPDPTGK